MQIINNILPVILGADMNCYSVARAFHEAYGIKSRAFGKHSLGEIKYSKIIKFKSVKNIEQDEIMIKTLDNLSTQSQGKTKILIGCTDDYVSFIIRNKKYLAQEYIIPYIDEPLMDKLTPKEKFYQTCDEYNIPYPQTVLIHNEKENNILKYMPFSYPIIIKPSSSILYWKYPFYKMKKIYVANNFYQAKNIISSIYCSGYPDKLIIQERIPGNDDGMRVLMTYSDQNAKVKMLCFGHILLQEHTPKGLGNDAATLTIYNRPLMEKMKNLLDEIKYEGFSDIDIKYDPRDNKYKVLEINLRQGRSNYYITGAGINIAKLLVEDRVLDKDLGNTIFFDKETFWHSIPSKIIWKYTSDKELVKKAQKIVARGEDSTTLGYKYDLKLNPLRKFYILEHNRRYASKYKKYLGKAPSQFTFYLEKEGNSKKNKMDAEKPNKKYCISMDNR